MNSKKVTLLIAFLAFMVFASASTQAQSAKEWVLEDFTAVRYNGDSPPNYLFNNEIYGSIVNNYDLTNHWLAIPVTSATSDHPAWSMMFQPYPYDASNSMGYAHSWIKSGPAWSPATAKRLRFWWRPPFSYTGDPGETGVWEFGIYVRDPKVYQGPAAQGYHSYTEFTNSTFAGQWVLTSVNWNPSHLVTDPGGQDYPPDVFWNNQAGDGQNIHYFDGLTCFYFSPYCNGPGNCAGSLNLPSGSTVDFTNYVFTEDPNAPDHTVRGVAITYTGTAFHLMWETAKDTSTTYKLYYSRASMKQNGLSSGTLAATISYSADPYNHINWTSAALPVGSGMWWAIQDANSGLFHEELYTSTPYLTLGGTTPPGAPSALRVR